MSETLAREIVDENVWERSVEHLAKAGVRLPRLSELANPKMIDKHTIAAYEDIDPDAPEPGNLFRVHWHNGDDRRTITETPAHIVLTKELTGVDAKIIVAIGNRFPMIQTHKVLAAYGCLAPRLVTGQFNPTRHRAIWPSTGNYCRGGIAISRILGCRGVAVLPEGMSAERFQWLERWVDGPEDIIRTPGTESNVKEIYDACHVLAQKDNNVILNQFNEFGNYIIHRAVTGPALEQVFLAVAAGTPLRACSFVSATGSAGTIAAGDYLKSVLGVDVCAVEALECPTLLMNGYGEHNIQGIGDKHIPFIHNALNTDYVIGVSDAASDALNLLFNTSIGRDYLARRTDLGYEALSALADLGLSAIANVLGAIKYAKYQQLGPEDAVLTLATDGAELYSSEIDKTRNKAFRGAFDSESAAEIYGRYLLGTGTGDMKELTRPEREAIFNLGYFTWVEQQGVSLPDFEARRDPSFWDNMMELVPIWDGLIDRFNAETNL
ncbi:MAG: pyridoxal-phosphate dependent enzyme [Pseudomonadota bacterium]|nr:pyridoxal-phosphate dependent enzyme [Pseudomonadota bacterium]